jgi:hypothetical protein
MGGLGQAMIATRSDGDWLAKNTVALTQPFFPMDSCGSNNLAHVLPNKAIALVARLIADRGLQPHSPLRNVNKLSVGFKFDILLEQRATRSL